AIGGARMTMTLGELRDGGFLVDDSGGGWRITHALVRDAIYERLSPTERIHRHGLIADALAGSSMERLAPQLKGAGRWADAADAYLELGQLALERGWPGGEPAGVFPGGRGAG